MKLTAKLSGALCLLGILSVSAPGSEGDALSKGVISIRANTLSPTGLEINGHRSLSFTLAADAHVTLEAFAPDGRRVAVLLAENMPAGRHERRLNVTALPNGQYFYRLRTGDAIETRKVMLGR